MVRTPAVHDSDRPVVHQEMMVGGRTLEITMRLYCVVLLALATSFLSGTARAQSYTPEAAGILFKADAMPASAQSSSHLKKIIFSNLASSQGYKCCEGWALGTGNFAGTPNFIQGEAFTPVRSMRLKEVIAAINLYLPFGSGVNEVDLFLMSNDGDKPGDVIESFHFDDSMGTFMTDNQLLTVRSSKRPILLQGQHYWLIASLTDPNGFAAWNLNSIGEIGTHAALNYPGEPVGQWRVWDTVQGAFELRGTPVPAP
jgi:hypothetical protein